MIWKSALLHARFWFVLALASGQLTAEQRQQILDLHNQYRSMVSPAAAGMLHMVWNETLRAVAQGYVAKCTWEHNNDVRNLLGESLYLITSPLSINQSMANWFDEHKHYDYDANECRTGEMCGHYTQMVWAKSYSVGCASHFCKRVENMDIDNATILVCNYFPRGNKAGEKPYEKGIPCSKCPQKASRCVQKTCAQTESTTVQPTTSTPRIEPGSSAGFTTYSVATLLLTGLTVYFIS